MKNPNLIPKPFAQNGQKDAIPANHKSDLPSQKATWDTGFPQITMMPVTAGGLPPSGRDFNGILNQISENIVYLSQGGKFKYSQEYADSTGGYPKGAILQSDDEAREFQSLVDNNKINFNKESTEKVNTAWKQVSTTQLLDELNKKLNRSDVVQSVGNSKSQVMSQNAVTDALNTKQDKGDYATNTALNQVNDNANSRLEKAQNGADIQDKAAFVNNIGAYPKAGGILEGNIDATGSISGKGVYEYPSIRVYSALNKPSPGEIGALSTSGTAVAASKLATARTIAGVPFDGTANITIPAGHVDAYTKAEVDSLVRRQTDTLLGSHGWWKGINTGFILQWGLVTRTGVKTAVEFPIRFPDACFNIQLTLGNAHSGSVSNIAAEQASKIGFVYYAPSIQELWAYWLAVGY